MVLFSTSAETRLLFSYDVFSACGFSLNSVSFHSILELLEIAFFGNVITTVCRFRAEDYSPVCQTSLQVSSLCHEHGENVVCFTAAAISTRRIAKTVRYCGLGIVKDCWVSIRLVFVQFGSVFIPPLNVLNLIPCQCNNTV